MVCVLRNDSVHAADTMNKCKKLLRKVKVQSMRVPVVRWKESYSLNECLKTVW